MAPISIATASAGLVQPFNNLYTRASQAAGAHEDGKKDIEEMADDIASLSRVFATLQQHAEQYGDGFIPDLGTRSSVEKSLLACYDLVKEIEDYLDGYLGGGPWRMEGWWAAFGQDEVEGLHVKVAFYKDEFESALTEFYNQGHSNY